MRLASLPLLWDNSDYRRRVIDTSIFYSQALRKGARALSAVLQLSACAEDSQTCEYDNAIRLSLIRDCAC